MAKAKDREPPYPVIMHGISGHLSRREACFLYDTPKRIGGGLFAELGTFRGRATICMAGGMRDSGTLGHIITVDAYDGRNMSRSLKDATPQESVEKSLKEKRVESYITLIKGDTAPTAKDFQAQRFDFLFIDADHRYEGCKADFEAWKGLVVSGGEVAFHDAHKPEVNRVVEESGWKRYDVDTIAVITKP